MAAFLAKTIHKTINPNFNHEKLADVVLIARKKPMKANGIAKMVCEKVTNERYFFIFIIKSNYSTHPLFKGSGKTSDLQFPSREGSERTSQNAITLFGVCLYFVF